MHATVPFLVLVPGSAMRAFLLVLVFSVSTICFGQQVPDTKLNTDNLPAATIEPTKPEREITNRIGMKLVLIPAGKFTMGSPDGEAGRDVVETQHEVTISQDYYLGAYEVTQDQYKNVMGANPSRVLFRDGEFDRDRPVTNVSWQDATAFCQKLSEQAEEKKLGRVYRLPTEAELEYACRAGRQTVYSLGNSPESLGLFAAYEKNSRGMTANVASKKPNDWGLYDLHGNVWEYCADWDGDYQTGPVVDPTGPTEGKLRSIRGGSVNMGAQECRAAIRCNWDPQFASSDIGFRVVVNAPGKKAGAAMDINSLAAVHDRHSARLNKFLSLGQLQESAAHFQDVVAQSPQDQQARLALAITKFSAALEQLAQSNYRYGVLGNRITQRLPLARLPIPSNPDPQIASYEEARSIVQDFQTNLQATIEVLNAIDSSAVKLKLFPGRIRLDLDGNGKRDETETLWQIFRNVNNGIREDQGRDFEIGWDGGDVHWLKGYIHVLLGLCDMLLAYDETELFEHCGHLVFDRIKSPFLVPQEAVGNFANFELGSISDLIAAVHLLRFKLNDPARMAAAHQHFLQMVSESRKSWELILAETDNDHEWLPNSKQTSLIGIPVGDEVIAGWNDVIDEIEAILLGKKLIPFWRDYAGTFFGGQREVPATGRGFNLKKFFLEPNDFDFLLALQGTAVEPYLEQGELSTPDSWNRLTGVFQGQFFGFAIWFN